MRIELMHLARKAIRHKRHLYRPIVEVMESRTLLATFTVTNTGDSGRGSLRDALQLASNDVANDDIINFQISTDSSGYNATTGSWTITINSGLTINKATFEGVQHTIFVDGLSQQSQPGAASTHPVIEITPSVRFQGQTGLTILSSGNTVRGLVINGFPGDAIALAPGASKNLVTDNYLGTNVLGTTARGNHLAGVRIGGSSNTIANNVISANTAEGIFVTSVGNQIQGNFIGTNSAGTAALGNGLSGITLQQSAANTVSGNVLSGNGISAAGGSGIVLFGSGAHNNLVAANAIGTDASGSASLPNLGTGVLLINGSSNNTIGGTGVNARNVISGNTFEGILASSAPSNSILGNYIGTNAAGTAALGNGSVGIRVSQSAANTISGNVIAGSGQFGGDGIRLTDKGTDNNLVQANFIGTDKMGSVALGNSHDGVLIQNGATNNTVGGVSPGAANLISGNLGHGVAITGSGTTGNIVTSNQIGTNVNGTAAVPNQLDGVFIGSGAASNSIGGSAAGAGNLISGNLGNGIEITGPGTSSNLVAANRIGTTADGNSPLPNQLDGVFVASEASGNTIGGATAVAGNLISGNNNHGVEVNGASSGDGEVSFAATSGNVIASNIIGLNVNGSTRLGNGLDGVMITNTLDTIVGPGNVISGNGLNGQEAAGVDILGPGTQGTRVFGNLIGTDLAGTAALGNSLHGVFVGNGAVGTLVGPGNVISGNGLPTNQGVGVYIFGSTTTASQVISNLIGTDQNGAVGFSDSVIGVLISQSSGNTVQGNLISGNRFIGVEIAGGTASGNQSGNRFVALQTSGDAASNNQVVGNRIGNDLGGTRAIPNGLDGIFINNAPNNTIGGTAAGAGNLISGNGSVGIQLFGPLTQGNVIEGNGLGLDSAGRPTLLNPAGGIFVNTGPLSNQTGGTASGQPNRGQARPKFSVSGFHQSRAALRKTTTTSTVRHAHARAEFRPGTRKPLTGR